MTKENLFMSMPERPVLRIRTKEGQGLPFKANPSDAGMDAICAEEEQYDLAPGEIRIVHSGVWFDIPPGYEIQVRSRSGCTARGLVVANGVGTVDSGYEGEVGIILHNISKYWITIMPGDRVAQFVFCTVPEFSIGILHEDDDRWYRNGRGVGGFGSTGGLYFS